MFMFIVMVGCFFNLLIIIMHHLLCFLSILCLQMWILGNPVTIEGSEFSNTRAIYICNHASVVDICLIMWLIPKGTVIIAKREVSAKHSFDCYNFLNPSAFEATIISYSYPQTYLYLLKET